MILLIDAYNVVRFLHPGARQAHDAQVAWFLKQLSQYRQAKKAEMTEFIVVFDGGLFSHKTREIVGGIVTVYAGGGRKADDVLVAYAQEFRQRALLITNDRELQRRAEVFKSSVMGVADFWDLVQTVCARQAAASEAVGRYAELAIVKYDDAGLDDCLDMVDGEGALDRLMVAGSLVPDSVVVKAEQVSAVRVAGSAMSKKDKARQVLRKKLG